jgi:RNA polymerase sigma-32 factor
LSPEEQQALAQKFRETGDMEIARRLVTTNLRLVVKIALEYKNAYHNVLDLIQEGNVGLMKAVSNYDPYKGTRLSYYASWWIRSYILKFLLDNFRLVKVGTTQAQKKLFYNLMREKDRLEAQGIHAGPKLLADQLNVKEKEVREMSLRLSSRGGEFSIDQPMGGDEDSRAPRDLLVDPGISVDESLAQKELTSILSDHISEFVHGLNEKERIVFQERLMNDDPKTLQEVADQFGITRERARQIESKVIEKLRKHMSVHMDGIELSPPRR